LRFSIGEKRIPLASSGFFYWRNRPPTMLELRTEQLSGLIADIYHASNGTYGVRRVTAELRLGYELTANPRRFAGSCAAWGCKGSLS
jgi:putative transposase